MLHQHMNEMSLEGILGFPFSFSFFFFVCIYLIIFLFF